MVWLSGAGRGTRHREGGGGTGAAVHRGEGRGGVEMAAKIENEEGRRGAGIYRGATFTPEWSHDDQRLFSPRWWCHPGLKGVFSPG
jgi:hypothetical protein